mmetsp:Transcript_7561/g.14086  ORF Transcript_7561/g.14086 Transcript_7561/m.14086 type:complete len:321 (-) Transcript_7561:86-1048(-)
MTQDELVNDAVSNSSDPQDLIRYAQSLDVLPPWSEASAKERWRTIFIYLAVYFPVLFVLGIAFLVFGVTVALFIYPLVGPIDDDPAIWYWHSHSEHENAKIKGWIILGLMIWLEFWLLLSLYQAIVTNPGTIPESDEWLLQDEHLPTTTGAVKERRIDGNVRHCVSCAKIKPDRCHHCRLCDSCVLKMDHHCPWIANCVGYYNYKYFFLLVTYGAMGLLLFVCTFWECVVVILNNEDSSTFLCLFAVTVYSLGSILAIVLTGFLIFHCYLVSNSMTTIEFCEKRKKWNDQDSPYMQSWYKSWQEALGPNPLLWPFPFCKK